MPLAHCERAIESTNNESNELLIGNLSAGKKPSMTSEPEDAPSDRKWQKTLLRYGVAVTMTTALECTLADWSPGGPVTSLAPPSRPLAAKMQTKSLAAMVRPQWRVCLRRRRTSV